MDALEVVDRVTQLVEQGRKNSTYKLAVLMGLLDLCLECTGTTGLPPSAVTTRQLAEKVVALYWPQVREFREGYDRYEVLSQNQGKQGLILRAVRALRVQADREAGLGFGAGVVRVRAALPGAWLEAVETVEWVLIEQPLPKLQRVAGRDTGWLYEIGWDDGGNKPRRAAVRRAFRGEPSDFANDVRFQPGVAEAFARLHLVLRPYLEQRWTAEVARMNELAEGKLHGFLFGENRSNLVLVRRPLLRLQEERCFYCATGGRSRKWEVDHFLPWSRFADDSLANLVVACAPCNRAKQDHLVGAAELQRWRARPRDGLEAVADGLSWEVGLDRTVGMARGLYGRLPVEPWLWSGKSRELERSERAAVVGLLAG